MLQRRSNGPSVTQRHGERTNPRKSAAAIRWFQADNATERSGNSNRSAGIRPERTESKAEGNSARRSATRSAGDSVWIPGIARRAVMRIDRCYSVSKLVQVRFSNDYGAPILQHFYGKRILFRDSIREHLRPGGLSDAPGVVKTLHRNRNAQ